MSMEKANRFSGFGMSSVTESMEWGGQRTVPISYQDVLFSYFTNAHSPNNFVHLVISLICVPVLEYFIHRTTGQIQTLNAI